MTAGEKKICCIKKKKTFIQNIEINFTEIYIYHFIFDSEIVAKGPDISLPLPNIASDYWGTMFTYILRGQVCVKHTNL